MADRSETPKPKTEEVTFREKNSLAAEYQSIYGHWQEKKFRNNLPNELNDNFTLVDWGRPGFSPQTSLTVRLNI